MENKDVKKILGRFIFLREKNDGRISGFIRNGTVEGREAEKVTWIEQQLRKEREAGLLVQAVLDQIPDKADKRILELRYLLGLRISEIVKEFFGHQQDFEEHSEAYRVEILHRLDHALLAAAKVLRQLGLDNLPVDGKDPNE